jgi:hypothetical protein
LTLIFNYSKQNLRIEGGSLTLLFGHIIAAFLVTPPHIPYLPSSPPHHFPKNHPPKTKKMNTLIHSSNHYLCRVPYPLFSPVLTNNANLPRFISTIKRSPYPIACATSNDELTEDIKVVEPNTNDEGSSFSTPIDKELKRVSSLFTFLITL